MLLWPGAFLVAATIAVVGIRAAIHHTPAPARAPVHEAVHKPSARYYKVRAGDTLAAVVAKTGVPTARLLELNPKLTPTALFLGQEIRLR